MTRPPSTRTPLLVLVAGAVGAVLLGVWVAQQAHLADRFVNHSVTVDAHIVRTVKLGCFGPIGSGTGIGNGDTVYAITFPHPGGVHETTVTRPCAVIPPDFGRGRGAIWIQYDVDDLDRTRVLHDTRAEDSVPRLAGLLVAWVVAAGVLWLSLRQRVTSPGAPRAGRRGRRGGHGR